MRCQVCGWPDGPCQEKKRMSSFFYIHLRKSFLKSMTVPCFMRSRINNLIGRVMLVVSPEQEYYVFHLKKKPSKTRLFGPGYNKFLSDYNMKPGDRIRFQLDHPPPFVTIFPEGDANVPKERVLGNFCHYRLLCFSFAFFVRAKLFFLFSPNFIICFHFLDAQNLMFSKALQLLLCSLGGLQLTTGQTARMNYCVLTRDLGLGVVYVHRLTNLDVSTNGLRISKEIVSVLNMTKRGYAILTMEEDGKQYHNKDVKYYTR